MPGLLKYLDDPASGEDVADIKYDIYDKECDWEHVADALVHKMADARLPAAGYQELDLGNTAACAKINLGNCDLVIFEFPHFGGVFCSK